MTMKLDKVSAQNRIHNGKRMPTFRKALIDNATLSGVERLTGISRTLNLNYKDNDILCLEKLITAILFSDSLLAIDDYKAEYRSDRAKNFSFIDFKRIEDEKYSEFSSEAASFANEMTFTLEGSKPAGDVVSFFDSIKIDPQLRWGVYGSSEYLTLSYLVSNTKAVEYEKAIDSALRHELSDQKAVAPENEVAPTFGAADDPSIKQVKDLVQAFKSRNPNFVSEDGKSALNRMIFGYGWAAERSYFYNAVSKLLGADLFLAPLRDAFCESCVRLDYPTQVPALLEGLKGASQATLSAILEPTGQARYAMRLPFFVAYLISQVSSARECIEMALKMRDYPEFKNCRTAFHNLMHLTPAARIQEQNSILNYLRESCENLLKKYSIRTSGGLQASVSLGLSGPSVSAGGKIGSLLRSYRHSPFSKVFRNIAQDMLNVERLGSLHDKLCASVREHSKSQHPRISATPKYMEHRKSEYGRPAEL